MRLEQFEGRWKGVELEILDVCGAFVETRQRLEETNLWVKAVEPIWMAHDRTCPQIEERISRFETEEEEEKQQMMMKSMEKEAGGGGWGPSYNKEEQTYLR